MKISRTKAIGAATAVAFLTSGNAKADDLLWANVEGILSCRSDSLVGGMYSPKTKEVFYYKQQNGVVEGSKEIKLRDSVEEACRDVISEVFAWAKQHSDLAEGDHLIIGNHKVDIAARPLDIMTPLTAFAPQALAK